MGKFNRNMFLVGLSGFFVLSIVCFFAIYTAMPDSDIGYEILSNGEAEESENSNTNNYYNDENTQTTDTTTSFENNFVIENDEIEPLEEPTIEDDIINEFDSTPDEDIELDVDEDIVSIPDEDFDFEIDVTISVEGDQEDDVLDVDSNDDEDQDVEEDVEEKEEDTTDSSDSTSNSSSSSSNSSSSSSAENSSSNSSSSSSAENSSSNSTTNSQQNVQLPNVSTSDNGSNTVKIIAAGDNLIHTGIYTQAAARGTNGYYFDPIYDNVKSYISGANIASVNQETVMAKSYEPSSYPRFNTPIEMADTLKNIGFDVISLANNHAGDKGADGLSETLDLLKNDKGLVVTGSYFNQSDYNNIPVFDINGIKVSYVATTQWTNDLRVPTSSGLVTSYIESEAEVKVFLNQVAKAKAISDIVVVNIHWGFENTLSVNSFQTGLAQRLVSSGADIIIGHHPHVLQPIEFIQKSDGSYAVCYYSVGNLISAQNYGERMIGGLADVTISRVDGKAVITDAKLIPIITHYGNNYANISTYSYDTYTSELANSHGVKGMNTPSFSMDYIYNVVTKAIDRRFLPDDFYTIYGNSTYSNAS